MLSDVGTVGVLPIVGKAALVFSVSPLSRDVRHCGTEDLTYPR